MKKSPAEMNQVAVRIIGTRKKFGDISDPGKPNQATNEPIQKLIEGEKVIEPPFDMLTLSMMSEHSSEFGQCVDAMIVNTDGFGHRLIPRVEESFEADSVVKSAVDGEKINLENFFAYVAIEDSFTSFRMKLRSELEHTGNAYFEVVRSKAGDIQTFVHIPSYQMMLGRLESEPILTEMSILKKQKDGSIEAVKMPMYRKFRQYVQSKYTHTRSLTYAGTPKIVWFKQFGDPRIFDKSTGELAGENLSIEERATELVHFKVYSPRTPYGIPRYIGNLLSIFGDRASEEINFTTFKNNNIPSMAIAVSGGQLTSATIQRIQEFSESQIQSSDNMSKFMILEGRPAMSTMGEEDNTVKIDIKPLTKEQHKDALFQKYSDNNHDKIRRVWRLPPIFVGRTQDYTRATSESSRRVADEQIFAPLRNEFDEWINRILFPEMGVVYHKYKSNTPNTTDNVELVNILARAEKTGGMTPRIARLMLQDIFGQELPPLPDDFPANVPFSLTMAEAVKNMAEASEPGQQVTALKALEAFQGAGETPFGDEMMDSLISLREKLEKRLQEQAISEEDLDI